MKTSDARFRLDVRFDATADVHAAGMRPDPSGEVGAMPYAHRALHPFANERRAIEFEKYLKSGSGCAFAVRHFR
jgi:hypothetical protein